jgi:twitching motility protein PilU
MNLSFGMPDVGNFRLSCFWQRGTPALVVRYIPGDIPPLETLGLPPVLTEVIMEKRGLILMVGATGSGKSTTLASMIDHRNAASLGPHPDAGRPDRIPVQAQEVHRQPARDRHRHQGLGRSR